jgi:subtilisin family serine protease
VIRRLSVLGALVLCMTMLAATPAFASSFAQASATPGDRQILVMVKHPPDHFRPNGGYGGSYGDDLARSARRRLARRIAHDYGLKLVDDWPMPMMGLDCFVMAVTDGRSTAAAVEQVSRDSAVAWSQPVSIYRAQSAPVSHNDPLYPVQPAAKQWRLAELHELATGRGVRVAIIDSGISANHPDLAGQLIVSRNFVDGQKPASELHGTGVAGIIAARADNGIGIAGVAPQARILGLRACWQSGPSPESPTLCDSFSLVKALYFAIEGKSDVINLSLSGPEDRLIHQLIDIGLSHGISVIAAVDPGRPNGGFPASVRGVIAVSNATMVPALAQVYTAPGRDVPTTEPGGRWFLVNGSSYSAAHVSGLMALVRQRQHIAAASLVTAQGGTIDACATVLRAATGCDCNCTPARLASARFRN